MLNFSKNPRLSESSFQLIQSNEVMRRQTRSLRLNFEMEWVCSLTEVEEEEDLDEYWMVQVEDVTRDGPRERVMDADYSRIWPI